MRNKRGSLSVGFLIGLILTLAGFLTLIYFIVSFYSDDSLIIDNVCKISVLTRATAPISVQSYVPLKCYTGKICFTKKLFGECEQFAGEEDVKRIVLPSNNEDAARRIEEVSAIAKYNCWEMMGQGKLDLMGSLAGQYGFEQGKPTCVICSRLAIDLDSFSDLCDRKNKEKYDYGECREYLERESALGLVDINRYMENNYIPSGGMTYIPYFTGKAETRLSVINEDKRKELSGFFIDDYKNSVPNADFIKNNFDPLDRESFERTYIFSQVIQPDLTTALTNIGRLGAAITPVFGKAIFSPYFIIPGLVVAGGAATYAYINTDAGIEAAGTYCGQFQSTNGGSGAVGCSLVQGVPYDYRYVNAMCKKIEGNP